MAPRPKLNTRCVASAHTNPGERVAEFSAKRDGKLIGGLLSMFITEAGKLRIDVYRADPEVEVVVSDTTPVWRQGKRLVDGCDEDRARIGIAALIYLHEHDELYAMLAEMGENPNLTIGEICPDHELED